MTASVGDTPHKRHTYEITSSLPAHKNVCKDVWHKVWSWSWLHIPGSCCDGVYLCLMLVADERHYLLTITIIKHWLRQKATAFESGTALHNMAALSLHNQE